MSFAKKRLISEITAATGGSSTSSASSLSNSSGPIGMPPTPGGPTNDVMEQLLHLVGTSSNNNKAAAPAPSSTESDAKRRRTDGDDDDDDDDGNDNDNNDVKEKSKKKKKGVEFVDDEEDEEVERTVSRRKSTIQQSSKSRAKAKARGSDSSDDSDSDDDDAFDGDWGGKGKKKKGRKSKIDDDDDEDEKSSSRSKKKKTSSSSKKKSRKASSDESEDSSDSSEESDSDDSSSDDSDSDDSSDSDSDSSDKESDEDELSEADRELLSYGEDLMGDAADRARLAALTEKEREQVLFERSEQVQVLREKQIIRQQLKEKSAREKHKSGADGGKRDKKSSSKKRSKDEEKERKKKKKLKKKQMKEKERKKQLKKQRAAEKELERKSRKSSGGDDDVDIGEDEELSSGRIRNKISSKSAEDRDRVLNDLKARRSADSNGSQVASSSSSSFKASRSEDENDDDLSDSHDNAMRVDKQQQQQQQQQNYDLSLSELNSIRLSRSKLERWVHTTFFNDTVIGAYVRIGIGAFHGQNTYRVAKVVGVEEGKKIYALNNTKTNKLLELDYCGSKRSYRMEYVSSEDFTDQEFFKWKSDMINLKQRLPSKSAIEKKVNDIKSAQSHQYSSEEVNHLLEEKRKFQKANEGLTKEKDRLKMRLKVLQQENGDPEEIDKLVAQISEIEAEAEELHKKSSVNLALVAQINERNRLRDMDDHNKKASEEGGHAKEKVVSQTDPFERRACRPMMFAFRKDTSTGEETGSKGKPDEGSDTDSKNNNNGNNNNSTKKMSLTGEEYAQNPVLAQKSLFKTSLVKTTSVPMDIAKPTGDLFSSKDLDIDFDIDVAPMTFTPMTGISSSTTSQAKKLPTQPQKGKTISLSDYKSRLGLF